MASVSKRTWTHNGETKSAWVVRYVDLSGKRRMQTFELKKEADRARMKIEVEIEGGVHTPANQSMTVAQLAKEYQSHMMARHLDGAIGRGYIEAIALTIRSSILPVIGGRKLVDLAPGDLGRLIEYMRKDQKLSAYTIKDRRRAALAMEAWGVRRGFTKRRVLGDAAPDYPVGKGKDIPVPSKQEVFAIVNAANERSPRQHARTMRLARLKVHLAAFCGLRYGEICGLTEGAPDFAKGTLQIRHSITRYNEMKRPKSNAGTRDVPMPGHVVEMLKDWIARDLMQNDRKLLLTNERGNTMSAIQWHTGHWQRLLVRAGLRNKAEGSLVRFHSLRHFAGSWWIENGMPIPLVSTLLGHADSAVTMKVYAHALQTRDERHSAVENASSALLALWESNKDVARDIKALEHFN